MTKLYCHFYYVTQMSLASKISYLKTGVEDTAMVSEQSEV